MQDFANDPYVWRLATVFLAAFEQEKAQKERLLAFLQTEEGRLLYSMFAPDIAKYYEKQTLEEQEVKKRDAAIAVGVGAAIQFALKESGRPA